MGDHPSLNELSEKKELTKEEELILSSWMCLEHWNETAVHSKERTYIVSLLEREAKAVLERTTEK